MVFPAETRILVVDDLKTIRILLTEILNKLGYESVDQAADGMDAYQKMVDQAEKSKPYGLIIADWNMPGMTGIELLQKRNADDSLKSIPFLMVTIESEREYVLKAVSMGVNDFVVKPFSEKTIQAKLQSIWRNLNPS